MMDVKTPKELSAMADADLTELLKAVNSGGDEAYEALINRTYKELRRLAGSLMKSERSGHTLQPTALVNEAFLRLVGSSSKWENRAHFMGAAARAMRRILVEHARQRSAKKRGSNAKRVTFADVQVQTEDPKGDILALDEALSALKEMDQRLVKVVELRYFAGCSLEEAAKVLGVSVATVKRDWTYARAWLMEYMSH